MYLTLFLSYTGTSLHPLWCDGVFKIILVIIKQVYVFDCQCLSFLIIVRSSFVSKLEIRFGLPELSP